MSTAIYSLRVFDEFNQTLAFFHDYRSLQFYRKLNDIGNFNLTLRGSDERANVFSRNPVRFIEIIRKIKGGPQHVVFEGIYTEGTYTEFENRNSNYMASGHHLNALLARRVVAYPPELPYSQKSIDPNIAIAQYIDENILQAASNDFRDKIGTIDDMFLTQVGGYGVTDPAVVWSGDKSGKNLLDTVQDISIYGEELGSPSDFDLRFMRDPSGEIITSPRVHILVTVYNGYLGTDRTIGNTSNNVPLVFATKNDNITNLTYWIDGDETNCITVRGSNRKLISDGCVAWNLAPRIVVQAPTRIDNNKYNQVEREESDRQTNSVKELVTLGYEWLGELDVTERVKITIKERFGYYLFENFNLGDAFTVQTLTDKTFTQRLNAYNIQISSVGNVDVRYTLKDLSF